MSQLVISIITVCLNSEKTLKRTIESVFSQNYGLTEYIVIDGGSKDGTLDIIHEYEDRLAYWTSEPDRGIYDAMNKGIEHSHGDIIAFINSDDWYAEGAFKAVLEAFEDTEAGIIYGDYGYVTEKGIIFRNNELIKPYQLKKGRMICHQSMFFRRRYFDLYGNYDLDYKIASDYAWTLNAYNNGVQFKYIPVNICYFSQGGISSNPKTISACAEEMKRIAISALREEEKEDYLPEIEEVFHTMTNKMEDAKTLAEMLLRLGNMKTKSEDISQLHKPDLILFGGGNYADTCIRICQALDIRVMGIVDNDRNKWGTKLHGILVHSPDYLKENDDTQIVIASVLYEKDIIVQLEELGFVRNVNFVTMSDWEKLLYHKIR